jgi:hypothetical protein
MGFSKCGIQTELDRFLKSTSFSSNSIETISKSAFSQSRQKLKPNAFIELYKKQLNYFNQKAPKKSFWKNKRIIAIDGSVINLPTSDELFNDFGYGRNQYENIVNISAKCSFAYDVENELIIDAQIDSVNTSEKEIAVRHLSALDPENDILVFDRGYPAFWLITLLLEKGFEFCFRVPSFWKDAESLMDSNQQDAEWVFEQGKLTKAKMAPYLKYNVQPKDELKLRMSVIKLKSDENEILITNLYDMKKYTLSDLNFLYNKRWGIEECYKLFKKVMQVENFTGKSTIAILQDFYAKVLMFNTSSMIRTQAISHDTKKNKYKVQTNKTQVLAKTKDYLIALFYKNDLVIEINNLFLLLNKCYDIVREGRSFIRLPRGARRRLRGLNYKGI